MGPISEPRTWGGTAPAPGRGGGGALGFAARVRAGFRSRAGSAAGSTATGAAAGFAARVRRAVRPAPKGRGAVDDDGRGVVIVDIGFSGCSGFPPGRPSVRCTRPA